MSKWQPVKLGDIASNIQTGPFGSQLHQSDYSEIGTPVVMPKDLVDGKISEQSIARVEASHVKRLAKHKIQNGDILYSRRGDVGRCAYAGKEESGWLCGTGCLRVTIDESHAFPKFIFYQLQTSQSVGWVEKHAVGSTMLNLNTSILSNVPVSLPPLEVQRKIADILSAYDDLIENNRKQIKLLEEAAQRLYKEWFIDLRFPGHENTPIIDGIPAGWRRGSITDISVCFDGKRIPLSTSERNNQNKIYPYYGAASLMDYVEDYIFDGIYLLFGEDGTVISRDGSPILQYVWGKFWVNNHAHIFQGTSCFSTEFLYMLCKHLNVSDVVTGVAQPKISQGRLNAKKILIPQKNLVLKYTNVTKEMFKAIRLYNDQIILLTETRNRLLPKLMTGELEVE